MSEEFKRVFQTLDGTVSRVDRDIIQHLPSRGRGHKRRCRKDGDALREEMIRNEIGEVASGNNSFYKQFTRIHPPSVAPVPTPSNTDDVDVCLSPMVDVCFLLRLYV